MIFRCQNGRLLNTDHVVEWDKATEESDDNEQRHTVTATTILGTSVEVFEGTQDECQTRLDTIYTSSIGRKHKATPFVRRVGEAR